MSPNQTPETPAEKTALTPELREGFKALIAERSRLYFKDHLLKDLEAAVSTRMRSCGLRSALEYYALLTSSEKKEDEVRELLNLLTIEHTYFFRNEPHFKALKANVLPRIMRDREEKTRVGLKPVLRIWSAGCSTGEEPYSIAMVVSELVPNLPDWDIQILATDASTDALEQASKGVYGESSLKRVNKNHLRKYFTRLSDSGEAAKYRVRSSIKRLVRFDVHDLMDKRFPTGFDVIFCRNVVIYFEAETAMEVMNRLHSSLNDSGNLFIGYSESLHFLADGFRMVNWSDAVFYRKKTGETVRESEVLTPAARRNELGRLLEDVSKREFAAEIEAGQKLKPPGKNVEDILVRAIKSSHLKQYNNALGLIDEALALSKASVLPYYLSAEIYMNQDRYVEAKQRLLTALGMNSLFAPAHYLFGCIYTVEGELEKARESLSRALDIDEEFLLARFHMAQVCKSEDRLSDAIREYRNALSVLSQSHPDDLVPYSGGLTVATLMSVCRDNLERLG